MFRCFAKGNPPIIFYKLLHNGKEIGKNPKGRFVINEVTTKNNGKYCCIPINRAGLGQNKTVVLLVQS